MEGRALAIIYFGSTAFSNSITNSPLLCIQIEKKNNKKLSKNDGSLQTGEVDILPFRAMRFFPIWSRGLVDSGGAVGLLESDN